MSGRPLRIVLVLLGLMLVGAGAWVTVATYSFGKAIAPFGGFDEHDLRDVATFFVALGLALRVSARRAHWRFPILVPAALEYAVHAIDHAVDLNDSESAWIGAGLAAIAAGAGLSAWLAWVTVSRTA